MQDELDEEIENVKQMLHTLKEYAKSNNGRYPSEQVISFVREHLKSMVCRNQGYILDGFGSVASDLRSLFSGSAEEDEEKASGLPGFVVSMECSEDTSKERFVRASNLNEEGIH